MALSSKKPKAKNFLASVPDLLICAAIIKSKYGQRILRLAVDTGATSTIVRTEAVLEIGLKPSQSDESEVIVTANGVVSAPAVEVPLFGSLGIELHGFKILCHDLPAQSQIMGVLGLDFLDYFPPFEKFRAEILKIAPQFWRA